MRNSLKLHKLLLLVGLLIALNLFGCASSPIPVGVPCAKSPSIPECLATKPQTTEFRLQFKDTSKALEAHLQDASQQLETSETQLRNSLSKQTPTPPR